MASNRRSAKGAAGSEAARRREAAEVAPAAPEMEQAAEPSPAPPATAHPIHGNLDHVSESGVLSGWCWSPSAPDLARDVAVLVDDVEVAVATCDVSRPDLVAAGVGDGAHALLFQLPEAVRQPGATSRVSLRDVATGLQVGTARELTWPVQKAEAHQPAPAGPPVLHGNLDRVTRDGWVSGWCWYPGDPSAHVDVTVLIDDEVVGTVVAAGFRPDLQGAGIGDGTHGFSYALPWSALADKGAMRVAVVETGTGRPLGNPIVFRVGRMAAAEERIQDLERQVRLLRSQLDEAGRHARARDDERAARELFSTVASFFADLAEGGAEARGRDFGLKQAVEDVTGRFAPIPLAVPDEPIATLCIPASAPFETLYRCLRALHEAGADGRADIVVVDAGGGEAALLPAVVRNLQYLHLPPGADPLSGLDQLARTARGGLLACLAPQLRVQPGWLDELAATFAAEPGAALVGGRVVREDGLLHHGGIVLAEDGRLRDLGRLGDAERPEVNFMRPVDAVADLGFVVRRDRLDEVGAFGIGFTTPGHAVVDLCMRLRARGHAVLYQPLATSVWAETEGAEPATAPDLALQDEDTKRLRLRWFAGEGAHQVAGTRFAGHALVIDDEIPHGGRDAGSVATLEQMHLLRRMGWRVTFAPAAATPVLREEVAALERSGIEVVHQPAYGSVTMYLEQCGARLDLVQIYRHHNCALFLDRVRDLAAQAKIVFSPADLHHLREQRAATLRGRLPGAAEEDTRIQELQCVRRSDATIVVSDFELDLLKAETNPGKLNLLRWVAPVHPPASGFAARHGACFVGSFRHPPNMDGVLWFVAEVLPLVLDQLPDFRVHVAGSAMPDEIRALASESVVVHGWVDDLGALFGKTRMSLAPLRYGAGFKGKVGTSLSYGLPVVGTSVALEGTGLDAGEGMLVADDAAGLAGEIVRLHENGDLWQAMSQTALERCRALYSDEAATEVYRRMLRSLGLARAEAPSR
jgi:O-antigen biosynthesis protein